MYSFNNDYSEGAHPQILEAIFQNNLIQHAGYGLDEQCKLAKQQLKIHLCNNDVDIHFVVGGTQANLIAISRALRPWQAVISTTKGHINVHETGAIEATGHKVIAMQAVDGKMTPALVQAALEHHTDEHMVQPKMVYISNTTEIGTQYTKSELEALYHFCNQNNLYLYLDGARLGSALTNSVNDLTLEDISRLTHLFSIGGTKTGALFGEALVISHPELKSDMRFIIKQSGALLAKGWLIGIQFDALFKNNLFYDMARHSNEMSDILRKGILECGYSFYSDSRSNQLFPLFPQNIVDKLSKEFLFSVEEKIDDKQVAIRLVTSWATVEDQCHKFVEVLKSLTHLA